MFDTLIVQPIFNLLVLIYALIPGHNFGLAIILFTIVVRLLLWPLVKKQLHQAKLMRKIQPDLKRIAKETKGNRQLQAQLQMEMYKEKGISPFRSIGVVMLQLPILIGLYVGLQKVIKDPNEIINFAYPALQKMPWLQELSKDIDKFDMTLFGFIDLHAAAINPIYIPALLLVLASVIIQFFQARQLMPVDKDARSLKSIMQDAGKGKQADSQEVNAAVGKVTLLFLPLMIFVFTIGLPSALSLYWLVGGLVAFIQQSYVLREDTEEMEQLSEEKPAPATKNVATKSAVKAAGKRSGRLGHTPSKISISNIPEAEIVSAETTPESYMLLTKNQKKKASKNKSKKRRKR